MSATASELEGWLGKARHGQLTNEECKQLTTMGYMDALRELVTENDLAWILPDILKYSDERGAFHISLTGKFAARDDIKAFVKECWPKANVYQKSHLIWRILDDPDLSADWHSKLFEFVDQEWGQFQETCSGYYGGTPEGTVAGTVERYLSHKYPASKNWAYLCNLATVKIFPCTVDYFLERASQSDESFERRVANALKARR